MRGTTWKLLLGANTTFKLFLNFFFGGGGGEQQHLAPLPPSYSMPMPPKSVFYEKF